MTSQAYIDESEVVSLHGIHVVLDVLHSICSRLYGGREGWDGVDEPMLLSWLVGCRDALNLGDSCNYSSCIAADFRSACLDSGIFMRIIIIIRFIC